jgi:hypothetical protein
MLMRHILSWIALAVALAGPAAADGCRFSEPRSAEIDTAGATRVRIEAGAGSLTVLGHGDLDGVKASGTACAPHKEDLEDVRLTADRSGDEIRIVARVDEHFGGSNRNAWLDLTVDVPAGLAVEVRDGSGEVEVSDVASLDIRDGSGEMKLRRIHGDARIEDGSGSMDVREVDGSVLVDEDGSGEIVIAQVGRDVEIGEDGSGSITITNVKGSVRIGSDGSGSIRAEEIAGDFQVRSDGSGGISVRAIGGRVDIP